jgi:outer membrane receptor protein involved in Fe transport
MKQGFDPYKALLSNLKLTYRPNSTLSSELQIFYSRRNPTFIDEVAETTSNEKDYEYGMNFIQSIRIFPSNVLRFGGLYSHWVAPNGKRFYLGKRCDTETISAVMTDEQKLGPFTLDAGLRITGTYLNEYAAFNIEGEGGRFRTVTPVTDEWEPAIIQGSLGATYYITEDLSAYLNSAAGQVKPRVGTLLDNIGEEPVSEPLNETRIKIDLGIMKNFGTGGKITLTTFSVIQKNAIALSGNTYLDSETNIRRELYLNRDQNQMGIELDILSPELFGFLRPFFNLTAMQSKMEEDEEMVINKENPVFISGGGVYGSWKSFDLNILGKYVSPFENERFVNPADGPQPLGDFFVLDLNGGYTFEWEVPVRLYIRVKNTTDKIYSTVNGWPDFGRMVFAGIQVRFSKEPDME